jgi:hypothetical protein
MWRTQHRKEQNEEINDDSLGNFRTAKNKKNQRKEDTDQTNLQI